MLLDVEFSSFIFERLCFGQKCFLMHVLSLRIELDIVNDEVIIMLSKTLIEYLVLFYFVISTKVVNSSKCEWLKY